HAGVEEKAPEPRRRVGTGCELHEMRVPVSCRELYQAQPVAMRVEPHRLGVDGDGRAELDALGQVAPMQLVGHLTPMMGRCARIGPIHPPSLVRPSGVEPPLLSEHGPEPCASANSATGALLGIRSGWR